MKRILTTLYIALATGGALFAQKDTTGKGGIDIISSFKPVLRQIAKIGFSASPPAADTTLNPLRYEIPNQNLLFAYQPGTLRPLALAIDSGGSFQNDSYVKAGFGSLRTPYVQAGFMFGDGKTAGLNLYARHVSSKGTRDYQQFSHTDLSMKGFFRSGNTLEWNAALGMKQDRNYLYGYEPQTLLFPLDSLRQRFQTIHGRVAVRNLQPTAFGLTYSPDLTVDVFSDQRGNAESNTVLRLPLQKMLGTSFSVLLGATFDLTRLSPEKGSPINNTVYSISPSLNYQGPKVRLQAGIRPSWDNGRFKLFPNIMADISTEDKRFTFQAGWTGQVRKTTYMYLASQNPWLQLPLRFQNTWMEERFAGFKGTVGGHVTYAAKVAFNRLNDQPLFINDTVAAGGGRSFRVVNERRIQVLNLGGEVGVNYQEKFSLLTRLQFNQYAGMQDHARAWGLLPLEVSSTLRMRVLQDLWIKGDLFAWSGPAYRMKDGSVGKLDGAVDLNAGLEFRIRKDIRLWTQFNNLFNTTYQRWNQYPVYGFNFTGGIVFSFRQTN
ncbi:MAG: hypothetical protein RJA57_253 [Bacteroidota bacterium]